LLSSLGCGSLVGGRQLLGHYGSAGEENDQERRPADGCRYGVSRGIQYSGPVVLPEVGSDGSDVNGCHGETESQQEADEQPPPEWSAACRDS
jgi:hypothetical protein